MITQYKLPKVILSIFILTFCLIFIAPPIRAKGPQDYNIKTEKVVPGDFTYPFKRLSEKFIFFTKLNSNSKLEYSKLLTQRRFSELISVVDKKNLDLIGTTSQRFSYQAGITAELTNEIQDFQSEIPVLEELRDNFPANSSYWLYLQQNIDTLKILSSKG